MQWALHISNMSLLYLLRSSVLSLALDYVVVCAGGHHMAKFCGRREFRRGPEFMELINFLADR